MPKHSFSKMPLAARCAIVVGATVILAFLLCLIMSAIAAASENPTKNLTLYGEICFCISMLFCGFAGAKSAADNRFASGLCAGGIMLLITVAASIVFGGDSFAKEAVLAATGFVICATGAALGARERKRYRKR